MIEEELDAFAEEIRQASVQGTPASAWTPSTNGFLLYDLTIDPSENVDLSQDPAHASVVDSGKALLASYEKRMMPALYTSPTFQLRACTR